MHSFRLLGEKNKLISSIYNIVSISLHAISRISSNNKSPGRKVNLMLIKLGATPLLTIPYVQFKRIETEQIGPISDAERHSSKKDRAAGPIKIDTTIYNQSIFISMVWCSRPVEDRIPISQALATLTGYRSQS